MDINRRKQSKERSKGLLAFSASGDTEKLIFPSSDTEGKQHCVFQRTPALGSWLSSWQRGLASVWRDCLAQLPVGGQDVYEDLVGEVVCCFSLLGVTGSLKRWDGVRFVWNVFC